MVVEAEVLTEIITIHMERIHSTFYALYAVYLSFSFYVCPSVFESRSGSLQL